MGWIVIVERYFLTFIAIQEQGGNISVMSHNHDGIMGQLKTYNATGAVGFASRMICRAKGIFIYVP